MTVTAEGWDLGPYREEPCPPHDFDLLRQCRRCGLGTMRPESAAGAAPLPDHRDLLTGARGRDWRWAGPWRVVPYEHGANGVAYERAVHQRAWPEGPPTVIMLWQAPGRCPA